jgi:hypothetical protein
LPHAQKLSAFQADPPHELLGRKLGDNIAVIMNLAKNPGI